MPTATVTLKCRFEYPPDYSRHEVLALVVGDFNDALSHQVGWFSENDLGIEVDMEGGETDEYH